MEVDGDNEMLARIAAGETLELDAWPALQIDILARLDKIAHTAFTIPHLPPPRDPRQSLGNGEPPSSSPLAEPSSQEADKENVPVPALVESRDRREGEQDGAKEAVAADGDEDTVMAKADEVTAAEAKPDEDTPTQTQTQQEPADPSSEPIRPGSSSSAATQLPIQLAAMLNDIKSHIQTFTAAPPHTLQRLAELVLHPCAHYRALATYLHAVDRVVQVTSGLDTYPLPLAVPDMSGMRINGVDPRDPASAVSWGNPTTAGNSSIANPAAAAVGSDEALGGALLTPIPWLTRRSPDNGDAASSSSGGGSTGSASGAQIHSEGTETIDGPNGMGSIETVSVSVNGVPSTGHTRGVTQGELLRQEQRAGVVPVSQLSRNAGHPPQHPMPHQQLPSQYGAPEGGSSHRDADDEEQGDEGPRPVEEQGVGAGRGLDGDDEEEEEIPHARGPDEIGVGDTGPQTATTSSMGEGGLDMQGIDVAAAVGRPPEQEQHPEQHPEQRTQDAEEMEKKETEGEETDGGGETSISGVEEPTGTKREAEETAESEPLKKVKEA